MCFLSGAGVAVVEVDPGRPRRKLVRERLARLDDLEDAVHVRRVDAVEVDRVRVRARVGEPDAEQVALGRPDDRTWHRAVVRPRREGHSRRDLDLAVGGDELVLAHASGSCAGSAGGG